MGHPDQFRVSSPQILNVDASQEDSSEPHANWYVSYAPEREDGSDQRVILATLHAVATSCQGTIQVAATISDPIDFEDWNSFEDALAASDALEMLYAFARTGLRAALSLINGATGVPDSSPRPDFDQLVRAGDTE